MLIKGENLTQRQREQVLSAYIYRWTKDNIHRETAWRGIDGKPRIPLISDNQWLREHAFYFKADGSRLMYNKRHAEPVYMADSQR